MSKDWPIPPFDQPERECALDPTRSILVHAPAGSGKTDLLTRRFLRLLAEVDDPTQIVAITFTRAAAAEMQNRILSELEQAARGALSLSDGEFAMDVLAHRALERSRRLGWNLLELPAQLRISTIDSFCRDIAIRQPLLSSLGGGLEISEQPDDLYRLAARRTLQRLDSTDPADAASGLQDAIELLLRWRDNNWQEMEDELVRMLGKRDRWMQDFVLNRTQDWDELRLTLERPFARAVTEGIMELDCLLGQLPDACEEMLDLARFAWEQSGNQLHGELAELAELPRGPFENSDQLEAARQVYHCVAGFLLTNNGTFRRSVNVNHGFPPERKGEKQRIRQLLDDLSAVPGLEQALASIRDLPPARYADDDWQIVRACFALLHRAAGELHVAFADAGTADYIQVAQAAQSALQGDDGLPTDAALAISDGIRHLLVDEFQDTSRRQHKLIGALVAAWPDPAGRTVFLVGDPMQSIYFFRDADAELFPRVRKIGLDVPGADELPLHAVSLACNFRTAPELVEKLNEAFSAVFAVNDGSGVNFCRAYPTRPQAGAGGPQFQLQVAFVPQAVYGNSGDPGSRGAKKQAAETRAAARAAQTGQIVQLIRDHLAPMQQARANGGKYRVAVLGRTRNALAPIAAALREGEIPFRAVDLETLADRQEVLDALALARALFNPEDRVAWLGVLRAPWCGLSLQDLHTLTSADDPALLRRPVPDLLRERVSLLSPEGRAGVQRVMKAMDAGLALRSAWPTASLGTWLERVWTGLGGAACVDTTARTNLDLLWRCLDRLAGGEPDMLGPVLTGALKKLTAQPDPTVSSDCGVQLMTIHKAKGLEFEVVVVPELQERCARTRGGMLAWLERGLLPGDDADAITEFLIAPFQPKGGDRGKAKEWVDREYRRRESQEMRRILYVAATRAREQLHLFARPSYKTENGVRVLCPPPDSLLSTAWPALEQEVRAQFDAWQPEEHEEPEVVSIAASDSNVIPFPALRKPTVLRRLPLDFQAPEIVSGAASQAGIVGLGGPVPYARHEGGLLSRLLGSAVHILFEELARRRSTGDWDEARAGVVGTKPRIVARVRAAGVEQAQAEGIAQKALDIVLRTSHDSMAAWILSPHPDAANEARWTGVIAGALRSVQVDRVFRAGASPYQDGDGVWWIVDYKTAHEDEVEVSHALPEFRRMFAPQLQLYGALLRELHGDEVAIRAGLYYPRMLAFDWWELE